NHSDRVNFQLFAAMAKSAIINGPEHSLECPRAVFTLRKKPQTASSWLESLTMLNRRAEEPYYRNDPMKHDLAEHSQSKVLK
ncbi:hypothetical protein NPIL_436811, partial [Nephila pilipes]